MSDTLKTAVSYINRWNRWDDGEQPTAEKFKFFFSAYSASLNTIANILGPSFDSAAIATTKERVTSSHSYESLMSAGEQEDFLSLANTQITNTFNLARVIGPHAVLNPQHLPGSVHRIYLQSGPGQALATGTKQQQLAFPPIDGYAWSISGAVPGTWQLAGEMNSVAPSKEGVAIAGPARYFYIDETGTLYSNQTFAPGLSIKYDLKVPNTYSYLGAGYNCIPDLSILTIADEDRFQDGEYGALNISYDSTYVSTSASRWKVTLPKVTSLRDSVFKTNEKQVAADGYEPAGTYSVTTGKRARYYTLPTDLYLTSAGESYKIEDNLICLYDGRTKQSFMLKWELNPDSELLFEDADGNLIQNAFYCYGPKNLESTFYDDSAATLLSSNTSIYNSKDFFIFTLGSTITEQLAQTSLNFSRHRHNGSDSYRIHHNDLLGSQGELQGVGNQAGADGGLDFLSSNRQLSYSDAKDNVHPQYFHRLGYRYGGSQGAYETLTSFAKALDLNAMQGDILFYPIDSDVKTYNYADQTEYDDADTTETLTWNLSEDLAEINDLTFGFGRRRGHALIFGWPYDDSAAKWTTGATKLYYENGILLSDSYLDNKGLNWTLSRHGFLPGDATTTNRTRALNIGWGNLSFGYREDIFGGKLSGEATSGQSTAQFRTSEFNITTTANNVAGNNTNSKIKEGYNYRDGFAVRALKGSSIWLSTGAESEDLGQISTGKNTNGVPGTIALEASYPSSRSTALGSETGTLSLNTLVSSDELGDTIGSGSGIFLSPGPFINTTGADSYRNPWVAATGESYKFASLWDSSSLGPVVTGNILDAAISHGPGSMLDIFALAPDRQKTNAATNGNIPVGTDNSLLGWVFGRPFIRGTYGINFCVNGTFLSMDTEFTSGYRRKIADQEWGPTNAVLRSLTNEYIHREFKFWGKNHDTGPSASADSYENTMGGNINLLYNFKRDYNRFGISQAWSDDTSLSGGGVGLSGNSQWSNSRRISLGSSKPEDYGSAIRQASYVEAFKGFRSDPLQPYYANYIIPFIATYNLGDVTNVDIENDITNKTFVLADNINGMPVLPSFTEGNYSLLTIENIFNDVTLDGLIRGSEEILLQGSWTISQAFPSSLVDFKVKLEYYVGQNEDGTSVNTGGLETPHTPGAGGYYDRIIDGNVIMVPAAEAKTSGGTGSYNLIPIVASSNGKYDPIGSPSNSNAIVGYSSAIGVLKNTNIGTALSGYRSKFPLFESHGRGDIMGQKQFCLLLNIHDRTDESYIYNSPVPYKIIKSAGDQILLQFRGTIHITTMTAYSRNPINDYYTHS